MRQSCEKRGLGLAQVGRRFAEVKVRSGHDAKATVAVVQAVEIFGENPLLAPDLLQAHRLCGLDEFGEQRSRARRGELDDLVKKGKTPAYRIKHANILLAIDANGGRLLQRLANFFLPSAYSLDLGGTSASAAFLSNTEVSALALAAAFLLAELVSKQRYKNRKGYHLMRKPCSAVLLLVMFILFGVDNGTLLYARI